MSPLLRLSSNLFATGWTVEPASKSGWPRRRARRSDVSVVPPTPDEFGALDDVLYRDPDSLMDRARAAEAAQGGRTVPLLRTASEELEDALQRPSNSTLMADMRAGLHTGFLGVGGGLSPTATRRFDEPWETGSPDPLADVIAADNVGAAATHRRPSHADAADELFMSEALSECGALDAAERPSSARRRDAARLSRSGPLASMLDDACDERPASRRRRDGDAEVSGGRELKSSGGEQRQVIADEEEIDAALKRFSMKRVAAPLDDVFADAGAEIVPGGSSLPLSPRQRRVRARPAATTKSIASLRSFTCGGAK